jgi:hypothetical protein
MAAEDKPSQQYGRNNEATRVQDGLRNSIFGKRAPRTISLCVADGGKGTPC